MTEANTVIISRQIRENILGNLFRGKAILIMGPRQCGKTTLLNSLIDSEESVLYLNCDDLSDRNALEKPTLSNLQTLVGRNRIVLIDEAQRVTDIGLSIKIMVDRIPGIQVIATGSSSFELNNRVCEPLTGRKYEYFLYPFSFSELSNHYGAWNEKKQLELRLVYGSYPDIVKHPSEGEELLKLLVDSYLFKDVFTFQDLRRPELLERLLRALALQLGSEISYTELAQITGTDHSTVQRYIQLLEQAYIIFRLYNYSNNKRNELKKGRKLYFWDNGVRNCLIDDFRKLELRNDVGKLWENYLVSERFKYLSNNRIHRSSYFWRNTNQSEIDYLEGYEDKLEAYEIKWSSKRSARFGPFQSTYPNAKVARLDRENYISFME